MRDKCTRDYTRDVCMMDVYIDFFFTLVIFKKMYRSDVRLLIHCVGHGIQRIQSALFTDIVGRTIVVVCRIISIRFVDSTHQSRSPSLSLSRTLLLLCVLRAHTARHQNQTV